MNRKGFTLVELLAVIVILAIVMLIAITSVGPLMEKSRKNALGDEGIALSKSIAYVVNFDPSQKFMKENTCVSLSYLYENEIFSKGAPEGYDGSVYVSYNHEKGKYEYRYWLTNGTYAYMGVTQDEFNDEHAVDYIKGTPINNCSGYTVEHFEGSESELDNTAPVIALVTDSDGTTFTKTKKMTISINETGSGLTEDTYNFKYIMSTGTITSCDYAGTWHNFTITKSNNYKKVYTTSNTSGKYKFYVCPLDSISDKSGNTIEPTLYVSDYYVDASNPTFSRFEIIDPYTVDTDKDGNPIEPVSEIYSLECDDATAHCDIYLCVDFTKGGAGGRQFNSAVKGITSYVRDTSPTHRTLTSDFVNKDNQPITLCIQGQDTPCKVYYYYEVCDAAGNCAENLYNMTLYYEDINTGYCS